MRYWIAIVVIGVAFAIGSWRMDSKLWALTSGYAFGCAYMLWLGRFLDRRKP